MGENCDGGIDEQELNNALGCLCTCAAFAKRLFETLDLDGSGAVSFREFTIGVFGMIFEALGRRRVGRRHHQRGHRRLGG